MTPKCAQLIGVYPDKFRKIWAKARKAVGLPGTYTSYSLRRGGATALFQHTGSFAKVAERGRWATERATRVYINQALADIAGDSDFHGFVSEKHFSKHLRRLAT